MISVTEKNFNQVYVRLLEHLHDRGITSKTRKGETITELFDATFQFSNTTECLALCRKPSLSYLEKEFEFYISGSKQLSDAVKLSSFWEKCSDDGETINSNYGKLIFHDKNIHGTTQFEHAVDCLQNNPQSKKAVMTLYNKDHAFISNDNPCTMFLRARLDDENFLHLTANMRSSDIYYGLTYDVPFFVFVQCYLAERLNAVMGTYTHYACSLHKYSRNEKVLAEAFELGKHDYHNYSGEKDVWFRDLVTKSKMDLTYTLNSSGCHDSVMAVAWKASRDSVCLKKKVGGVLAGLNSSGNVEELIAHCGSPVPHKACDFCVRDSEQADEWFGDECPSVHAEMKCINEALRKGKDLTKMVMYTTHGPCDACLKLCNLVGIKTVYYDKPYKTDYSHWPNIKVIQISQKSDVL